MIFDYIATHQAEFWLVSGFVLLALEILSGFAAGVFMFAGMGALITGGLMSFGVLPETWVAGISATGIATGVVTALLWKPLKNLQGSRPIVKDNSSDLVGHMFVLESEVSLKKTATTQFSGITWRVELDQQAGVDAIEAGQSVTVTSVEVGVFKVKPSYQS